MDWDLLFLIGLSAFSLWLWGLSWQNNKAPYDISEKFLTVLSGRKKKPNQPRSSLTQGPREWGMEVKLPSCACGCDPTLACPNFEIVGCGSSLHAGIPHAFLLHGGPCSQSHPDTATARPGPWPSWLMDSPGPGFLGLSSLHVKLEKGPAFFFSQGWSQSTGQ